MARSAAARVATRALAAAAGQGAPDWEIPPRPGVIPGFRDRAVRPLPEQPRRALPAAESNKMTRAALRVLARAAARVAAARAAARAAVRAAAVRAAAKATAVRSAARSAAARAGLRGQGGEGEAATTVAGAEVASAAATRRWRGRPPSRGERRAQPHSQPPRLLWLQSRGEQGGRPVQGQS